MEDEYLAYLFIAILFIIPIVGFIFTRWNAENIVLKYLHERGAKNIRLHYQWLEFDRDTMTFQVEFTHPNGSKISTRCKLPHWTIFLSGEIFWSTPLNLGSSEVKERHIEVPPS